MPKTAEVVQSVSLPIDLPTDGPRFARGDSNADGERTITDPVFLLGFLFLGAMEPPCRKSADADDNGDLDVTDGIYLLNFLFLGAEEPPPPFGCGTDPTEDPLSCESFAPCCG